MGHPVKKNSCSSNIVGSTFLQEMQIQSLAKIAEFDKKNLISSTFAFVYICLFFQFCLFWFWLFSIFNNSSRE